MNPYLSQFWTRQYPADVPPKVDCSPFQHLSEFYQHYNQQHADKALWSSFGCTLSYAQSEKIACKISGWLQRQSYQRGDRIGIMSPNCLQYPILIQAIHYAGLVVVNLNPFLTARELAHVVSHSQMSALFVWDGVACTLDDLKGGGSIRQVVVMSLSDLFPTIKKRAFQFVLRYIKKVIPDYCLKNFDRVHLSTVLKSNCTFNRSKDLRSDELAFLQYTGGTTGLPKGVMLTHANLIANVQQALHCFERKIRDGLVDNIIMPLPLYHIFSLTVSMVIFSIGSKNILITNPRDLDQFVKTLIKHPPGVMIGVNTLFQSLVNHKGISKVDFSHLALSLGGGMSVKKEAAEQWRKLTNCFILEAYGSTETSPAVTINPHDIDCFSGSIGLPVPNTTVHILDEKDCPVPVGKSGQITVDGPQVSPGYWQNSEANQKAFTEQGWYKTGDIGTMDKQGYVYLLDRLSDMIIVSGFNVYPTEIEQVIGEMKEVLDCACVGIKDNKSGEVVVAFIVKRSDTILNEEAVNSYCATRLVRYKLPKRVKFVDTLPKTPIGKVLRRELIERFQHEMECRDDKE